jgi:hypothetical protein
VDVDGQQCGCHGSSVQASADGRRAQIDRARRTPVNGQRAEGGKKLR